MQIKTTLRFHLTPVIIANIKTSPTTCVGEDVGKKELWYTVGGSASWCNYSGNKIWRLLKNLNKDLPYDPTPGDIPKGMPHRLLQRHLHTRVN
jgi:hypothetical protein